jgi:hypothetical protein
MPVIPVPRAVRIEFARHARRLAFHLHKPLQPLSQDRQHDDLPKRANNIDIGLNVLLEQPGKTLTFDTYCYISGKLSLTEFPRSESGKNDAA